MHHRSITSLRPSLSLQVDSTVYRLAEGLQSWHLRHQLGGSRAWSALEFVLQVTGGRVLQYHALTTLRSRVHPIALTVAPRISFPVRDTPGAYMASS